MDNKLRILSIGAGAIGTYIGGSFASVGNKVAFVDQPAMVERLKEHGLTLDLSIHPDRVEPKVITLKEPEVEFYSSLNEALASATFDVALFALKSFDTRPALEGMKDLLPQMPPILCLQNGVDNEDVIASFVGAERVIYGTVTSAIGRSDVGNIALEKLRGVGFQANHPLSTDLFEQAKEAGLAPMLFEDPADMKWSKMLTNLVSNATSAILDLSPADVFSDPDLTTIEMRQLKECLAVMKVMDIEPVDLPGTPVRLLAKAAVLPVWLTRPILKKMIGGGRGGKMPSFHIDLSAGRPKSEVGYLNGAVVRAGEKLGIDTPVNRFLNNTLQAMTDRSIDCDRYENDRAGFLKELKESEHQ